MTTRELKSKRWIPESRALADFESEVELKAKDFVYAMTDHNIKEHNITGKEKLTQELVSNASSTRKAMLERWITPEQLPAQEDLKKITKRRQTNNQQLQNHSKRLST
jgi:DNA-damage-inducible protein D